jgi:hypothetical protein
MLLPPDLLFFWFVSLVIVVVVVTENCVVAMQAPEREPGFECGELAVACG